MNNQCPEGFEQMPVLLLQHGGLTSLTGKTGLALLRHRRGPIAGVIDPEHAYGSLAEITGIDRPVPIVPDLAAALPYRPAVAVVGLAPSGGVLPDPVRRDGLAALRAGMSLASGLHALLGEDPDFEEACQDGQWIWDLRREPPAIQVAQARAAALSCQRVLAVGTDMAVGKMSACLALQAAAARHKRVCRFVGTGQAGILISGRGIPLDAVRVDFAAGAVEAAVLEAGSGLSERDLLVVEGQGSLCHPGSTATLPLMRGSQPTALLMVHRALQTTIGRLPEVLLPPLQECVSLCESLAAIARPRGSGPAPKVQALALNTAGLSTEEAKRSIRSCEDALGLPCDDPIRNQADGLLEVFLNR